MGQGWGTPTGRFDMGTEGPEAKGGVEEQTRKPSWIYECVL